MAFLKLCGDDPIVAELRDVFKANIVRIPEERIAPLTILLSTKGAVRFLGNVGSLLDGPPFQTPSADLKESEMATLTNRRSRVLDNEIGLQILSGLLTGMGGGSAPDVSTHLKETKALRFHFPAVRRRYIEISRIGQLLAGRSFSRTNLLFEALVDRKASVRIVDSVITSTDFEVEAGDEGEASFKVDLRGLQQALAGAKIEVSAKDERHLSFLSKRRLAFAFTCVNLGILDNGAIRSVAPSSDKLRSPQFADPRDGDRGLEEHVLLTRAPELIELDLTR